MKKLYLLLAFFHSVSVIVSHAQLSCDFTFPNPTSGLCTPYVLHVEASNIPAIGITERRWDLSQSGVTITLVNNGGLNPFFNYILSSPGIYSLHLWSRNANNDTCSITKTITISAKPIINFAFGPQLTGCPGLCVQAQCNSIAGSGVIDSMVIDWGCGPVYRSNTCPSTPITHCYNCLPGCYDIIVVIFNSAGCYSDTIYRDKVCIILPPVACFTVDTAMASCATSPLTVNFTACNSGSGMTYCWYINNVVVQCDTSRFFTHIFPLNPSCYDIKLTVTHPSGCSDSIIKYDTICVRSTPQICFTRNAQSGCASAQNPFNLVLTNCTVGLAAITWSIVGPCGSFPTQTGASATYSFTCTGCYIITASGFFGPGCFSTLTDTICVLPSPQACYTVDDTFSCRIPFQVCYAACPCTGCSYRWILNGAIPSSSGFTSNPVNCATYNSFGHFPAVLDIMAPNGCISRSINFDQINVQEINPAAGLNRASGCSPVCVNFTDQTPYASMPDSIYSVCWSFSGPAIVPDTCGINVNRCFSTPGCYDVTLSVTTTSGCVGITNLTDTICVGTPPVCTCVAYPLSMCFEEEPVVVSTFCDSFDFAIAIWGDGDTSIVYTSVFEHFYLDTGCMLATIIPYRNSCPGTIMSFTVCVYPPTAKFTDSTTCQAGDTVFLRNESIGATRYKWYFCNGDSSTAANPVVVLPRCDSCNIRLIAYNDTFGCSHQISRFIYTACSIASILPSDTSLCGPAYIFFRNISSSISPIPYAEWDLDTTNGIIFQAPPLNFQTAVYNNAGIYVAAMRNMSSSGCIDTAYAHVRVCRPVADFTSANTCYPNPVCFSNQSVDSFCALSYIYWDFGDGIIDSISQNPCHTYAQPGSYQVRLWIGNNLGCQSSITRTVVVSGNLALSYSVDSLMCPTGNQHCIINNSTGFNPSFLWIIPNALPSDTFTSASPCYTIPIEGDYVIRVVASSNNSCTVSDSFPIHVCAPEVSGSVSPDYISCSNPSSIICFTSTASCYDSILIWNGVDIIYSNLDTVCHIYPYPGIYPVCLTAYTRDGCIATNCLDTINISGPHIDTFSISQSTLCACRDTLHISFGTIGASSVIALPGCAQAPMQLNPISPIGTTLNPTMLHFDFTYCLTDSCQPQFLLGDSTCVVYFDLPFIYIDSPLVNFTYDAHGACLSGTVCFTESTHYTLSQSHSVMWHWDFGDGSTDTVQNPCHYYSGPGVYNVLLRIISNAGCYDSVYRQVSIHGYPGADFGYSLTDSCNAATICFSDSTNINSSGVITKWLWCFGDATCDSSGPNPCHVYPTESTFEVTLRVEDENGCANLDSTDILVSSIDHLSAQISAVSVIDSCTYIKVCLANSGTSEFPISYHSWDASGIQSDSAAPCFRFFDSGLQYLDLHITDIHGCVASDTASIATTLNSLNAAFTFAGNNGLIQFTNTSTGIYVSASWDINGFTSGSPNPVYQFTSTGTYYVTLTIIDAGGCSDDSTISIPVIVSSTEAPSGEVEIIIVPNPFHDFTAIRIMGVEGPVEFRLMNLIGEEMLIKKLLKNEIFYLHKKNIASGLYLYEVVSKGKSLKHGKLIAE